MEAEGDLMPPGGLSVWAIAAIVANSAVGVLILILFAVLYKACKVPSRPPADFIPQWELLKKGEQKYLLMAAGMGLDHQGPPMDPCL